MIESSAKIEIGSTGFDICILVVEDNPDHVEIVKRVFLNVPNFKINVVNSISSAFTLLTSHHYHLILTDYCLPDGSGLDLIEWARGVPVIVMTSQGDENTAVDALKRGAYDYLVKNALFESVLSDVVIKTVERHHTNNLKLSPIDKIDANKESFETPDGQTQISSRQNLPNGTTPNDVLKSLSLIRHYIGTILEELSDPVTIRQRDCLEAVLQKCGELDFLFNDNNESQKMASEAIIIEGKKKILVVDDEWNILETIRRIIHISKLPVEVYKADNGDDAWDIIEHHRLDMVLLDVNLPHTSGAEILKRMKSHPSFREIHVVMMSGVPEVLSSMKELGADACLPKPFDVPQLLEMLNGILVLKKSELAGA
ncbi:MAG: response regulator [candidate division Zixibacteria bacterium]|nr:response regulator [candidate division Zixibacteria bacterium]